MSLFARLWNLSFGRSQFLRFALVGVAGYLVDATVLTVLVEAANVDRYSARAVSFICAASTTWWLNRHFTFAKNPEQRVARQWLAFLLVSTDGGNTWREHPLFEQDQPGAVEQFWFDSLTSGLVLIDRGSGNRHQLYRTMTGGTSWELERASADPVRFPAGRSKDATRAWRLQPDARTSSWQIEKNLDDHWSRVAAFATEVAVCH